MKHILKEVYLKDFHVLMYTITQVVIVGLQV